MLGRRGLAVRRRARAALLRLLRAAVAGDVADASGFSPFPGNINQLLYKLGGADGYAAVLRRTGGAIPEFVNPKYADASKTKFKSPTRLECMMQETPLPVSPHISPYLLVSPHISSA